jgi:hypothetical protein
MAKDAIIMRRSVTEEGISGDALIPVMNIPHRKAGLEMFPNR